METKQQIEQLKKTIEDAQKQEQDCREAFELTPKHTFGGAREMTDREKKVAKIAKQIVQKYIGKHGGK